MQVIGIIYLTPAENNFLTFIVLYFDKKIYDRFKLFTICFSENSVIQNVKKGITIVPVRTDKSVRTGAVEQCLFNNNRMPGKLCKIYLAGIGYLSFNKQ